MLLQTNSYIVPKEKRAEHARLLRRFRQTLQRLGCDHFEVFEQVGANWNTGETSGRFVQILRFNDRKHYLAVQAAELNDPQAQKVIAEFQELINFPYQRDQGLFFSGFYTSFMRMPPQRTIGSGEVEEVVDMNAESTPNPESNGGSKAAWKTSDPADAAALPSGQHPPSESGDAKVEDEAQ
jgi:hypothetical protein